MFCNFKSDFTIAVTAFSHTVLFFFMLSVLKVRIVRGKANYILDMKMVKKSQFVFIFLSKNIPVEFSNVL